MGFFSEVADFFDYMVNGENSESARRMREDKERLERKHVIGHVARQAAIRTTRAGQEMAQKGRDIQYQDSGCTVKVRNGYDTRSGRFTTDIVVYDRTRSDGQHYHLVLNDRGDVIAEHWKANK